jgi:hypothetical protein
MPNNGAPDGPMVSAVAVSQSTVSSNRSRTFEYLLQGIGWSHTSQEFDRLGRFARAHYTRSRLKQVEAAIASRKRALRVPDSSPDDLEAAHVLDDSDPLSEA